MDASSPQTQSERWTGESFGALLRRHRRAAELTQEELAERAGLGMRSIGAMEGDRPHTPRPDTVQRLAAALALSPAERAALEAAARRLRPRPALPLPAGTAAPPFVGRVRELTVLEQHLRGEGPPVLLLTGEPGIGKSRLLRLAAIRAGEQGWRVLEGGCQRRGGQEPYAPLSAAFTAHLRRQPPAQLRTDLRGCAWLVKLLPELAASPIEPLPPLTLAPEQERRLMDEAVARFLANTAAPQGTLLLLDDLQWAGPDALALMTTLARSAAEVPLRIAGAYRDTEVGPRDPLSVALADLAHAGLAAHHRLGPLAPAEAGELLDSLLGTVPAGSSALDERRRERLVQRTGGVPFFLVSYAQGLRGEAVQEDTPPAGGAADIPWSVAQTVRQRVAALPDGAGALLGVAAVAGRVVDLALLTAASGQDERAVLAAVEAADHARLLEEEQRAFRFAHDVIREVVEADLGLARRAFLHRQVAEALERDPCGNQSFERLAYHFTQGNQPAKAALYLERAGDRARQRHAFAAAEGYYRDAVARLEDLDRAHDAAAVREKLGVVLHIGARYDAALLVLQEATRVYNRAGDLEGLARVTAQIGEICAITSQPREGLQLLQPVHEALRGAAPSPGLAALTGTMPRLLHLTGRYTEALVAADRAVALAGAIGNEWLLAEALWQRGYILLELGPLAEARQALTEANRLAAAADHPDILGRTFTNLAWAEIGRGAWDEARFCIASAVEVAERLDNASLLAFALGCRGQLAFLTGAWAQARADLERAASLQEQARRSWWRYGFSLLGLGHVTDAGGDDEGAAAYLAQAIAASEHEINCRVLCAAHSLLAEHNLRAGQPLAARTRLLALLDRVGGEHLGVLATLPVLAWTSLELGDVEAAAASIAAAAARARREGARPALTDVLRIEALVAARRGDMVAAGRALTEGLALARELGYPYAEARLLHVSGDLQLRRGEPGAGWAQLEAARTIFDRLGARRDSRQGEDALSRLACMRADQRSG